MKKVTSLVLNNFTNDSRVLKENLSLQKMGYNVQVVALYEEPLAEFEAVEGIPVHRVKLKSREWSKHKLVQLIKYFEFVYRVIKAYKQSDIIHCNDLDALPIGVVIKKFFNQQAKVIYDAHEYETQTNGLKGFQQKLTQWLEKFLIPYADKVITVSDSIANEYVNLYRISKPYLVLNTPYYTNTIKQNLFRQRFNIAAEQTIFLYQGGLSKGRGIEILLDAFSSIDETKVIIFMGYGPLEPLIRSMSQTHRNIFFHEAVTPQELLNFTCSADFGISTIEDTCLSYRYCLPNKLFEYIMAEVPVIVSGMDEMKKLVEENHIGIVIKDNTPDALRLAIKKASELDNKTLLNNLRKLKDTYTWEEQEKVLKELYATL